MKSLNRYLAHVRRNEDGSFEIHHLEEHLRSVGDLAGEPVRRQACRIGISAIAVEAFVNGAG